MTMMQQGGQGGATTVSPPPPPSRSDLGREIQEAVREAIQASTQGASGAEQARLAGERARAAAEQLRAQIEASQGQTRTGIVVPPTFPQDVIPPQAVDISLAFFASMVFIIVGLPIARAFARRMDRKSEGAVASADLAPRLDRIEQAIEAVAIEVERVSENQRYSTRIISELKGLPSPNPMEAWPAAPRTVPEPAIRSAPDERRP